MSKKSHDGALFPIPSATTPSTLPTIEDILPPPVLCRPDLSNRKFGKFLRN